MPQHDRVPANPKLREQRVGCERPQSVHVVDRASGHVQRREGRQFAETARAAQHRVVRETDVLERAGETERSRITLRDSICTRLKRWTQRPIRRRPSRDEATREWNGRRVVVTHGTETFTRVYP